MAGPVVALGAWAAAVLGQFDEEVTGSAVEKLAFDA
jgi:hypothetical protein